MQKFPYFQKASTQKFIDFKYLVNENEYLKNKKQYLRFIQEMFILFKIKNIDFETFNH